MTSDVFWVFLTYPTQGEARVGFQISMLEDIEGRGYENQGWNFDMGKGGIKIGQKNSDIFYGRAHVWMLPYLRDFGCGV